MIIRRLEKVELLSAMHLVWDVFAEYTAPLYPPEGVAEFQSFIKIDNIMNLYDRQELILWGAFEGPEMLAVGALYRNGHIALLDVRGTYQNQGIGMAIFQTMKQYCAQTLRLMRMTVNAAPNAVAQYQKFGCQISAHEQIQNGIRYVPMEYMISPSEIQRNTKKPQAALIIGIVAAVLFLGSVVVILAATGWFNTVDNQPDDYTWNDEWGSDWDNAFEDDYGDGAQSDSGDDKLGIRSIKTYEASGLKYSIKDDSYYEEDTADSYEMCMDVQYPVIEGLNSEKSEEINQILRDCAMQTADSLYVNPSQEMKEYLMEQDYIYMGSEVRYKVTYMSEEIICVVFEDHYFWGNIYQEYGDLRTRTINLKDGTVYEIKDIIDLDDDFMDAWYKSMKEEAPDVDMTDLILLDDFKKIFEGEALEGRYYNAFFLCDGGLEIGLSYHYGDDDQISRGWMTAPFTFNEIAPYKSGNNFWKIVESID